MTDSPVRLYLLQKLHLVLNTGAGFQLLHHHLGGAETRADLAQQHLNQEREAQILHKWRQILEEAFANSNSRCCDPGAIDLNDDQIHMIASHPAKPAMSNLLQIQQTVASEVGGFQQLDWNKTEQGSCEFLEERGKKKKNPWRRDEPQKCDRKLVFY